MDSDDDLEPLANDDDLLPNYIHSFDDFEEWLAVKCPEAEILFRFRVWHNPTEMREDDSFAAIIELPNGVRMPVIPWYFDFDDDQARELLLAQMRHYELLMGDLKTAIDVLDGGNVPKESATEVLMTY